MRRQIKFRAWDKDEKRMLEVYRIGFDGPIDGAQVYCYLDDRGAKGSKECFYDGDGLTLEQYTGLKDANGKEIYEGDIIVSKPTEPKYEPLKIGAVKRSKARAGWCYETATATGEYNIWTSGKYRTYEVIGNVHENHELLEEV